jgi:hypothetical protein
MADVGVAFGVEAFLQGLCKNGNGRREGLSEMFRQ